MKLKLISALLFLLTLAIYATELKILVVSMNPPELDSSVKKITDAVNELEGVTAINMQTEEYNLITDFTIYDAAVITENGGSSSMITLAEMGWQIPVVNLKSYSLYKGYNPLFFQSDETWKTSEKSPDLLPDIDKMVVMDNSVILSSYEIGDEIQWTKGYDDINGASEAHIQCINFDNSDIPEIQSNATLLAVNKYMDTPENIGFGFLWSIEENDYTKRIVSWGIHHNFLQYATDDFYSIFKKSLKWVLDVKDMKGLRSLGPTTGGSLYPTFKFDVYDYKLAVDPSVDSIFIDGIACKFSDTVKGTGYFSDIPGIAEILVISENNDTIVYTIDISNNIDKINLSALSIDDYELIPEFDPDSNNYMVKIDPEDKMVDINAETDALNGTVTGTGENYMVPGVVQINAISEYGIYNEYVINVVSKSVSFLSNLSTDKGVLYPSFSPGKKNYTLYLTELTDSILISAISGDINANIEGAGYFSDIPGTATISVTSDDGYQIDYTIDVIDQASNARLSAINSSVGIVMPNFNPEITNYNINVPLETSSIVLTPVTESEIATVTGGGLISVIPSQVKIEVTAQNGNKKVYTVNVRHRSCNVLVVSREKPEENEVTANIIDCAISVYGATVTHMLVEEYNNVTDFSVYDAAILTESGGSSAMITLADQGWQIPVVCLKSYSLYKGLNPLLFQSAINWAVSEKTTELLPNINKMYVYNNDDILWNYSIGEAIEWTAGYDDIFGENEAHIQCIDFSTAGISEIENNATLLASNAYMEDNGEDVTGFLWKIEENALTKRVVSWGVHQNFLQYATDDFYEILRNSLSWVLEYTTYYSPDEYSYANNISTDNGVIYPPFNPNKTDYTLLLKNGTDQVNFNIEKTFASDSIAGDIIFNTNTGIANIKIIDHDGDEMIYRFNIEFTTDVEPENIITQNTTIYPSPVSEYCMVKTVPEADITVLNISGKQIYNGISNSDGRLTINTGDFEKGVYIVTIQKNNMIMHEKIIKR